MTGPCFSFHITREHAITMLTLGFVVYAEKPQTPGTERKVFCNEIYIMEGRKILPAHQLLLFVLALST